MQSAGHRKQKNRKGGRRVYAASLHVNCCIDIKLQYDHQTKVFLYLLTLEKFSVIRSLSDSL